MEILIGAVEGICVGLLAGAAWNETRNPLMIVAFVGWMVLQFLGA